MENADIGSACSAESVCSSASSTEELTAFLHDVQRKFGRNLLLLQQYERLMKAFVADQQYLEGPAEKLKQIKEDRINAVSKKSLGQVVGDLTGNCIRPALPEEVDDRDESILADADQAWFRISFQMEMQQSDFERTQQKLADLVKLRNDLVHHFLDSHDIWTKAGCQDATAYLDECFREVERHYNELRRWATHAMETRETMAAFVKSPQFSEWFVHGVFPDGGGVNWLSCTIVNLLRDAEEIFARNGWTLLQNAIAYIRKTEPEHVPSRYGCSSWRQVLHESAQFDIRREQSASGAPSQTWYKSR